MLPLSFASGKHLWSLVYYFCLKIFKKINTTTRFCPFCWQAKFETFAICSALYDFLRHVRFFGDELDCGNWLGFFGCMLSDMQRYLTCECVCCWSLCTEEAANHVLYISTVSNNSIGFLQPHADMKLLNHFLEYVPVILSASLIVLPEPCIIVCILCSLACHCDESDCAQCDRRPAGDFALCAVGWESAAWEAVAAQLRLGEDTERKFAVFRCLPCLYFASELNNHNFIWTYLTYKSFRWHQTSMWQWGGTAVCILRESGWTMPGTTPVWLKVLSGPPTIPPLSTSMVVYKNMRTNQL